MPDWMILLRFGMASIARYAELDNVELAYGMVETLQYRIAESGETLESRFEELAILSDSQVTFEGFGWHALNDARFPGVWSSAHEAVHGVTIEALEILAQPLDGIKDQKQQYELFIQLLSERGHALKISMVDVAKIQERIRRERLKLVGTQRDSKSANKVGRPKKGQPTTEALMMEAINKDPEAKTWTAERFAAVIGKSASTIRSTKTWQRLKEIRDVAKVEKRAKHAGWRDNYDDQ